MIVRLTALRRPALAVGVAAALLAGRATPLDAHDIPARVTLFVFVKPEPGRLRVLVRAPLETMRDMIWPSRGLGYLDFVKAAPMARDAAQLWIAEYVDVRENGERLTAPRLIGARIALPSERTFIDYDTALAAITGPPVPPATEIPWNQALIDVAIEYPIVSVESEFAIRPRLAHLGARTTTVLRYVTPDGAERAYQYRDDPGLVRLDPRWYHAGWQFVKLGVRHILAGVDHLLFVMCLVIPFRRLKPLILIVTAFTLAHSITLASAALGVVPDALWFPPLIEVLVAASILYMALENVLGPKLERRWLVAFGFGLVHGFAFSFALSESLQFAGRHLAVSLFTFNVGVELGQVAVLALAVPAVAFLFRRVVAEKVGIVIMSAFVAHTAYHWLVERGAGLSEYSFTMPAMDVAFAVSAMRAAIVALVAGAAAWLMWEITRRFAKPPEATP